MSGSRPTSEEIRAALVKTAKKQFLANGIMNTEMKEIASLAGLSRSTLYRYMIDRNQLAFIVSAEILNELSEKCFALSLDQPACGLEKLSLFAHHYIDTLCENVEMVSYLDEFDCLFRGSYPDIPEANNYITTIQRLQSRTAQFLFEGLADGSIAPMDKPLFFASLLVNTIFGLAERILPREEHYQEEHLTDGRSMMIGAVDVLLASIHNPHI